jgi:hypothetical protein
MLASDGWNALSSVSLTSALPHLLGFSGANFAIAPLAMWAIAGPDDWVFAPGLAAVSLGVGGVLILFGVALLHSRQDRSPSGGDDRSRSLVLFYAGYRVMARVIPGLAPPPARDRSGADQN